MIEDFAKKYQKSQEEKEDLIAAYTKHKGDMDKIMEEIPCATDDDESRFRESLLEAIKNKEIKSYKTFVNGKITVYYGR